MVRTLAAKALAAIFFRLFLSIFKFVKNNWINYFSYSGSGKKKKIKIKKEKEKEKKNEEEKRNTKKKMNEKKENMANVKTHSPQVE